MEDQLKAGSLLVHTDYELPEPLQVRGPVVVPEWRVLSGIDASKAEDYLKRLGWHFFYVVDRKPTARGISLTSDGAIQRALRKLTARAEEQYLNTIEIANVSVRRIGFLYLANVAVNFRHISATPYLFDKATRSETMPTPVTTTQGPAARAALAAKAA